jgi:hypothetical protein
MLRLRFFPVLAALGVGMAACATSAPTPPPAPAVTAAPPAPGIAPEDLVGRWGLASYQKEADRSRTVAAARGQCGHPYTIARGPTGGVMLHLPDAKQPSEMRTKAGPEGRRYIGPEGPVGDPADREIVSFDGRVLMMNWIDPEVAGRYGTMVYVRCAPRA